MPRFRVIVEDRTVWEIPITADTKREAEKQVQDAIDKNCNMNIFMYSRTIAGNTGKEIITVENWE